MAILRKTARLAMTATLLASLIAIAATPLVSASASATSAGKVGPVTHMTTGTTTLTFTENSTACFNPAGDVTASLSVRIQDKLGADTVSFYGTPMVSANASLGATAALKSAGMGTNNILAITFAASDVAHIEQVTVSGLQISASNAAAFGKVKASLINTKANPSPEGSCVTPFSSKVVAKV